MTVEKTVINKATANLLAITHTNVIVKQLINCSSQNYYLLKATANLWQSFIEVLLGKISFIHRSFGNKVFSNTR